MKKLISLLIVISIILCHFAYIVYAYDDYIEEIPFFDELDSHEDDPDAGLKDRDDFLTEDEYNEYLSSINSDTINSDILNSAKYPVVNTTGKLEYTIKNLPTDHVVQNFYIGIKYIYVTQYAGTHTDGCEDVYISRCLINSNNTSATFKDKMTLKGFGHNQILDAFTHNNTMYLWVGCKANTAAAWQYSLQLGRIQYTANAVINSYTDITRLVSLNRANTTGNSFGSLLRIDAALSSDKTKLLIVARNSNLDFQYSYFDANALNELLDEKISQTSKYVTFYNNPDAIDACLFSCVQSKPDVILPNKSCQGVDLTNANSIYIAGGGKINTVGVNYPKIAKLIQHNSSYVYSKEVIIKIEGMGKYSEIEGVRIIGDKLMFGIPGYDTKTTTQYIYSIDKTILSGGTV